MRLKADSTAPAHGPRLNLQQVRHYTGILAACAFAFFAWLSTTGANIALGVFLLVFILSPAAWLAARRDPLMWLFVIVAGYVALRTFVAIEEFPETRAQQLKDARNWLKLFAVLPMAWWLRGNLVRINLVMILAVSGLLLGMLAYVDWAALLHGQVTHRTGFKLSIIFSGLVSGTVLLGLLVFAPRIWAAGGRPLFRYLRIGCWFLCLYLSAYMLISSLSRGAWLATALAMLLVLFARSGFLRRPAEAPAVKALPWALLILGSLSVVLVLNNGKIQSRLQREGDVVASLLKGDIDNLPRTSMSYRIHLKRFGLKKWTERPFLGWGTGSTREVIRTSNNRDLQVVRKSRGETRLLWMSHLHDTYLEVLLRFGAVGGLLFAFGTLLILRTLSLAHRSGALPQDYWLFSIGSFGLLAIWSLFDFRALHGDWRAYWVILAGIAYSFRFARQEAPA